MGLLRIFGTFCLLIVLSFNATGQVLSYFEIQTDGTGGVDGLDAPYGIVISADDAHIYTASANDDAVAIFSKGAGSGLTFVSTVKDDGQVGGTINGLNGARRLAIAPDGGHIYVPTSSDDALVVFSRNSGTGAITYVETHFDEVGGITGLSGAYAVAVSPDNNHVYAVSSSDDALVVFSRNTGTGALTLVEEHKDGLLGVDGLNSAHDVVLTPDGAHLYVAGSIDDEIAHFTRNAGTGALTYVSVVRDGFAGVDGLNNVYGLSISADGAHLYAASASDDAVAAFSIGGTGALTYIEVHKDDSQTGGTVTNLNAARDVLAGVTGNYVYAVSSSDDGLVVFTRNSGTGALTLSEEHKDGTLGVDGLDGARSLVVPSDETTAYIVSTTDDAIGVFENDAVLPVQLTDFSAELLDESTIELNWTTASEINNAYFAVERSSDGRTFEAIAQVEGFGTTSERTDYLTFDHQPGKVNYYRLKQVDYDGNYSYSPIVSVFLRMDKQIGRNVEVYPNPVGDAEEIYLKLAGFDNDELLVTVKDIFGRALYSKVMITGGMGSSAVFAVDPEHKLAPGTYFVTGAANDELFSKKLVVR